MPIPSKQQLDDQLSKNSKILAGLKLSLSNFLQNWEKLEADENQLIGDMQKMVDKEKLKKVLKKIHSISE